MRDGDGNSAYSGRGKEVGIDARNNSLRVYAQSHATISCLSVFGAKLTTADYAVLPRGRFVSQRLVSNLSTPHSTSDGSTDEQSSTMHDC